MTHSPEEIKKALACCVSVHPAACHGCPYENDDPDCLALQTDALEYIQQLEKAVP